MQGHAPSNSNVGARSTNHVVNQSFACEFYPVDRAIYDASRTVPAGI